MVQWTYDNEEVTEMPDVYAFIYKLTYEDGSLYIGRKNMQSIKTIPALKNGEIRPGAERVTKIVRRNAEGKIITKKSEKKGIKGTKELYDRLLVDSDWLSYEGSHDKPKAELVKKEIIDLALTKIQATYKELEHLVKNDVLFKAEYLNKQINNMFYKGKI